MESPHLVDEMAEGNVKDVEKKVKKKKKKKDAENKNSDDEKNTNEKEKKKPKNEKKKKDKKKKKKKKKEDDEETEVVNRFQKTFQTDKIQFLVVWNDYLQTLEAELPEEGDLDFKFANKMTETANLLDESLNLKSIEHSLANLIQICCRFFFRRAEISIETHSEQEVKRSSIFSKTALDVLNRLETAADVESQRVSVAQVIAMSLPVIVAHMGDLSHTCNWTTEDCLCAQNSDIDSKLENCLLFLSSNQPHSLEPHLAELSHFYATVPNLMWTLILLDLYPKYGQGVVENNITTFTNYMTTYLDSQRGVKLRFGMAEEDVTLPQSAIHVELQTRMGDYVRAVLVLIMRVSERNPRSFTAEQVDKIERVVHDKIPGLSVVFRIFRNIAMQHPSLFKSKGEEYYKCARSVKFQKKENISSLNDFLLTLSLVWDPKIRDRALNLMAEALKSDDREVQHEILSSWKKFSKKHSDILLRFETDLKYYAKNDLILRSDAEEILKNFHQQKEAAKDKSKVKQTNAYEKEWSEYSTVCMIL